MKLNKTLALLVAVSAGYAATSYAQQTFDYSYTFADGLNVSGTLEGTVSGDYVTGVSDVTMLFNGTPVGGSIFTGTYNGSAWVAGGVVSFDVSQNDFLFMNSDFPGGNWGATAYLYMIPTTIYGGQAYASDSDPILVGNDTPANPDHWSLTAVPSYDRDPVPDGGCTAMLCGMSLLALGWLRRKLA